MGDESTTLIDIESSNQPEERNPDEGTRKRLKLFQNRETRNRQLKVDKKIKRKIKKLDQPDESTTLIELNHQLNRGEIRRGGVPETIEIVPESRDEEQTIEVDETKNCRREEKN
ncbi:hypothetical protein BLOT_003449 [Blomia tropicalis]|nr:hypothetical protein BLOT_003449 [Blomia tropicalis]